MPNPKPLTARQSQVLEFIRYFIDDRGYPPTIREIGPQLGMTSYNGVVCHLLMLEKKGYITREEKLSRGIRLTVKAQSPRGIPLIDMGDLSGA